jgi:predicted ArsR family transcriptional regulator
VIDLLRHHGAMSVHDLAQKMGVTATAVRQRLTRLTAKGWVNRVAEKAVRGRPSHKYSLTEQGQKAAGNNMADLAEALWQEVRSIRDPGIRNGLLQRIARTVARQYASRVTATGAAARMRQVAELMGDRSIPFSQDGTQDLPVLTAWACPYPTLAEQDRGVCAMENLVLTELVGEKVKLSECRLDGGNCCRFVVTR